MRTVLHFSPLHRSSIGFERVFGLLEAAQAQQPDNWPPFDTVKLSDDHYRIAWIPAASMVYTPEHAEVSADIVDVANGVSADYASDYDKVRNKIGLIYLGILPDSPAGTPYLPRWEKLALAIGHGARGVIFINPAPGNHLVTGIAGGSAKMVTIPVGQ